MITLPVWMAVLLFGLLPVVGVASYAFGWKWCERSLKRIHGTRYTYESRPMTEDERGHFEKAFAHMGRAFGEMDQIFKRKN